MTRIIALMPVRNEAWILDRNLQALSTFCDQIIVADQRSTDGTRALLESFAPKVSVIDNPNTGHSTSIRWTLLDVARGYDGNNLILYIDADEIPSSNILTDNTLDQLVSLPPGTSILVELVNLWRSPSLWRRDGSIWSGRRMEIGFRDDRIVNYGDFEALNDHNRRIPICHRIEPIETMKLLHFQHAFYERMLCKQRRYRASEGFELGIEKAESINKYYCITRNERHMHLEPVKAEWTAGWKEQGIDLESFEKCPLYWFDVEVLRYFADKGPAYFAPIDLWDVDWEAKRQFAKAQDYEGIPDEPISDPRTTEQCLYHAYLHRFFRTPPWRDPSDLARMPGRWTRKAARAIGLRRSHLERIGLLEAAHGLFSRR